MKIFTTIFFLSISTLLHAQIRLDENEEIIGIITNNSQTVIVTNNGYFKLKPVNNGNDKWLNYYRKIYNDTTLANPNTEMKGNFSITVVPYVITDDSGFQHFTFDEPIRFGVFFRLDKNNNYELSNTGKSILEIISNDKTK